MEQLTNIRKEISQIDSQLIPLFIHRMQLSQEIGKIKKENGLPVFDAAREEEILKKSAEAAGPEFSEPIQALYQRIFELSRSVQ